MWLKIEICHENCKQEGHDGPGVAHLSFPDYEV